MASTLAIQFAGLFLLLVDIASGMLQLAGSHTAKPAMSIETLLRATDLPNETRQVLKTASALTSEIWVKSGPEAQAEFKDRFFRSGPVKRKLAGLCGTDQDCVLSTGDALFCESLEMAGWQGILGDYVVLENIMKSNLGSTMMYGVDWEPRRSMIAKFPDAAWPAIGRVVPDTYTKMKYRIIDSSEMRRLVNETCYELNAVRPHCWDLAPRGLFCQVLSQAAAVFSNPRNATSHLEEALPLRGDAKEIVNSTGFQNLSARAQAIVRFASVVNLEEWINTGGPKQRTLKTVFVNHPAVKREVSKSCAYGMGECALRVADPMLCDLLEGMGDKLSTLQGLENTLMKSVNSESPEDGIDWAFRSAVVAKWGERKQQAIKELPLDPTYKDIKLKVLGSKSFKGMVEKTCWDLNRIRPGCWDTAPHFLFCQALSQAASASTDPEILVGYMTKRLLA